ncbi:SU10 major capsid protein [Ancylobacter sp.]|uniref:SU10 major capsid protein n=1 Tax=Ancylobacter sp. TaxID=1872567 RepID=UPI003C7E28CA
MAQPANTYDSYDLTNDHEDYADTISMISPTDTPFMSMIGDAEEASNTQKDWTTDTLAAADTTNARMEGADASPEALTPPVRVGNVTQISDKAFVVSGSARAIDVAGAEDEYLRQKIKKGLELRRDMEKILLGNQSASAGSDGAPTRLTGTMQAWIKTNTNKANDGTDPVITNGLPVARVPGTPRAFDAAQITDLAEKCYDNSSEWPTVMMVGTTRRKSVSELMTQNTMNNRVEFMEGKLVTSVRVYETDFGDLNLVTNRHMDDDVIALLSPDKWGVSYLKGRKFVSQELGKTGDNTKHQLISEYMLKCENEAANGLIADLIAA